MGVITHSSGTNRTGDRTIKIHKETTGDSKPIPFTPVLRDGHGFIQNHVTITGDTLLPRVANAIYTFINTVSLTYLTVYVNETFVSSSALLVDDGTNFKWNVGTDPCIFELKKLGV